MMTGTVYDYFVCICHLVPSRLTRFKFKYSVGAIEQFTGKIFFSNKSHNEIIYEEQIFTYTHYISTNMYKPVK